MSTRKPIDFNVIIFWVLWLSLQAFFFGLGYVKQRDNPGLVKLNTPLGLSVFISRGSGLVLCFDAALIFLPVCRNIITIVRSTFLGRVIPFDSNIYFHKQVGYSLLAFSIVHSVGHCFNLVKLESAGIFTQFYILFQHPAGITGLILVLVQFLMFTSAMPSVRKAKFELFYYTHHLAFVWIFGLSLHGIGCFVKTFNGICVGYYTWKYSTVGIAIYAIERILRMIRCNQKTYIQKVVEHPGRVIELQIYKPCMAYKPGQYVFINIPEVSSFEWHPFTLTSCPEEDYISVHIRVVGDWTGQLAQRLNCFQKLTGSTRIDLPAISLDGPYGTPTEDAFKYDSCVMIGAGIGVTPFVSVLKSVWFQLSRMTDKQSKLKKVYFIWICREKEAFEWFQYVLEALEEQCPPGFLQIQVYLTGNLAIEDLQFVVVNHGQAVDPITFLKEKTCYGRPNFPVVFEAISKLVSKSDGLVQTNGINYNIKNVGVFFCGPKPLDHTIQGAMKQVTSTDVKFHYHKEHF